MSDASRHILFLATEYDAPGMRPYARNIINTMWQAGDHVLIVTRDGIDNQAFPNIPPDSIIWIDYPKSKLAKAVFRYWPSRVNHAIARLVAEHGINLLYALTGELILAPGIKRMQTWVPILYTVHDAEYHDYKFTSLGRWLKDRMIIAWPLQHLIKYTPLKITNSQEQMDLIKQRFPYHKVHYAPFPTLVNEQIEQGGATVKELEDVDDGYILFFGTIHLYKGVHLLYEAHNTVPTLKDKTLVIAGTGDIYFDRQQDETNVIFINRFVQDDELRDLFSRAAVVVYPYTSATQSGVTSIASYFGKPMVLSDLPFFKQTCEGSEGITFFGVGDIEDLADAVGRSLQTGSSTRPLYDSHYSTEAMRTALLSITDSAIKHE